MNGEVCLFLSDDGEVFDLWILYGIGLGAAVLVLIGFFVYLNRGDLLGYNVDNDSFLSL